MIFLNEFKCRPDITVKCKVRYCRAISRRGLDFLSLGLISNGFRHSFNLNLTRTITEFMNSRVAFKSADALNDFVTKRNDYRRQNTARKL